jgi:hypothetical protein
VIAIAEPAEPPADNATLLRVGYPLLVRALANLCLLVSDTPDGLAVRFVTLEQGTYGVGPGLGDAAVCERAFERIAPLAASRLVIANVIVTDLPAYLWDGDEQTHQVLDAGRALDNLDLLPAPFPLEEILAPRELRHVQLLYGIGSCYTRCRRIAAGGRARLVRALPLVTRVMRAQVKLIVAIPAAPLPPVRPSEMAASRVSAPVDGSTWKGRTCPSPGTSW